MMKKHTLPLRALCLTLVLALLLTGCNAGRGGAGSRPATALEESSAPASRAASDRESPNKGKPEESAADLPAGVEHGDFLWQIEAGESTVYLMGTMHVLRDDYQLNPRVLSLYRAADALAVESNIKDPALLADSSQYIFYRDGSNIYDHLSERGAAHLREISPLYGYEPELFEMLGFNAFSISSLFTLAAAELAGFSTDGVDSRLLDMAIAEDKEILELEYYADLYVKMETLDDDTMERICILVIPEPEELVDELEGMYLAYLSGDDALMTDYLYAEEEYEGIEFEEKDELYNYYMLTERNEIMAASVVSYLEEPGTYFVAAGLAHFLGEGSIVELLEARGYRVERI